MSILTTKLAKKVALKLESYSPLILSCVGAVGVVTTSIFTAQATTKAVRIIDEEVENKHKLDKTDCVRLCWKCYIPAVITGAATITCVLGANMLNRKQQATLASAYTLLHRTYHDYQDKLKEIYGEEVHKNIMNEIAKDKVEDTHITAMGSFCSTSLDFGNDDETIHTFYDSQSERYFEATISQVLQAEYHLNRNFMFAGGISLNSFYEFLGLEKTAYGDALGWSSYNGDIYWIDFDHRIISLDDGLEVYVIDMACEPWLDWSDDI